MTSSGILILARFSSRDATSQVSMGKDDTLEHLFKRLSSTLDIETKYLTFTYNGKQYRHDSPEKSKRLTNIGLIDRATIFVVSRVIFIIMLRARYSFLSSSEVLEAEVENLNSKRKAIQSFREMRLTRRMLMQDVTVKQIKTIIEKEHHLPPGSIDIVSDLYGITHEDDESLDTTNVLKVVRHPNARIIPPHLQTTLLDITYEGEKQPRALLSCGHAMAADTLYQNITVQLKSGNSVLSCFSCKKEWDFQDTSEKAQMSLDEKLFWGMKVSLNSVKDECPKCGYYCQRIAEDNDRAVCMKCSKAGGLYEFCWKCKFQWKDNHKCLSKEAIQSLISNCETKTMPYSNIENVPSIRVCPSCEALIEHLDMCKEMRCYHCKKSFCFVCLTMCEQGLKCSSYNAKCIVAPRQTV